MNIINLFKRVRLTLASNQAPDKDLKRDLEIITHQLDTPDKYVLCLRTEGKCYSGGGENNRYSNGLKVGGIYQLIGEQKDDYCYAVGDGLGRVIRWERSMFFSLDAEMPAAPVPATGSWSYSPQKGKPGECFLAQVWDGEGKELATVKATHDEKVASSIAQLFAASPWLVHACNAALAAMNEMVPMPGHSDPGAIEDCKREIQEAINKATRP